MSFIMGPIVAETSQLTSPKIHIYRGYGTSFAKSGTYVLFPKTICNNWRIQLAGRLLVSRPQYVHYQRKQGNKVLTGTKDNATLLILLIPRTHRTGPFIQQLSTLERGVSTGTVIAKERCGALQCGQSTPRHPVGAPGGVAWRGEAWRALAR